MAETPVSEPVLSCPIIVALPVLNEAAHLPALLDFLSAEQPRGAPFPVLVLDGGSTDASRALVRDRAAAQDWLHLLDNPGVTQAAALNLAADWAADWAANWAADWAKDWADPTAAPAPPCLIRMDAHARYAPGFVRGLVRTLMTTGADSVTVPLLASCPPHASRWQQAAAALQRRWIGHGGAAHRRGDTPAGWVAHGHHAAFRLESFRALGGYDPRFVANEDAEYDLRLIRAGGRVFLDPALPVAYLPRASPAALARQMGRNGLWRGRCLRHHRIRPAPRQILPLMLPLILAGGLAATPGAGLALGPWAALPAALYGAALAWLCLPRPFAFGLWGRCALLAALSHLAFGLGLACGLLRGLPRALPRNPPARIPHPQPSPQTAAPTAPPALRTPIP